MVATATQGKGGFADPRNSLRPFPGFRVFVAARLTHGMITDTEKIQLQHLNDSLAKSFAEALIKARGDRSQAEFARMLGIANQQTYQRYENGLVPSGLVLHAIARRLGVTVDDLLTGGKVSPAAAQMAKGQPVLWASELEEHVQFTIALQTFTQVMTSAQLLAAINSLISNSKLLDKAKVYWIRVLGEWMLVKSELEEKVPVLAEQESGQPVNARTSINEALAVSERREIDLTNKIVDANPLSMPTWPQLKAEVRRLTSGRGDKSALARHCSVTRQAVATWLDEKSKTEPGAEATLRLLDWVVAEEAKQKNSGTGTTAPESKTQPKRPSHENTIKSAGRKKK